MDLTKLRLLAALMHSVPDARLRLTHDSGVASIVSYDSDACLNPCDWRTVVASASRETASQSGGGYQNRVVGFRFERGFDPIANVARRIDGGRTEFWFASTLRPERLRDIFAAQAGPVAPSLIESGILGDTELRVSVGFVREIAPCALRHLQGLSEALATQAAIAEITEEDTWAGSRHS